MSDSTPSYFLPGAPEIKAPMLSSVTEGGSLEVVCEVTAWQAPSLGIFRDRNLTRAVTRQDSRLRVQTFSSRDSPGDYKLVLEITNVTSSDGGQYYCHAVNSVGNTTAVLGVSVLQPVLLQRESLQCCRERNVSQHCLDVCHQPGLDYSRLTGRPECLAEYEKLVYCGSGGRDLTPCCARAGVPRVCSAWCRGQIVQTESSELCAIIWAKQIIG